MVEKQEEPKLGSLEYFTIPDFTGGVDVLHHPLRVADNKCLRTKNLVPLAKGILQKRKGSTIYLTVTDVVGGIVRRVVNLHYFPQHLAMLAIVRVEKPAGTFKDKLYVSKNRGAFTYLAEFPATDIWSMVEFGNRVYISNGTIYTYDGTNFGILTGTNIPKGKYLLVWKDRLWVTGDDANITSVYWSDNLNAGKFGASSIITPGFGDGDPVMGIGVLAMTTAVEGLKTLLFIPKKSSLWVLNFGEGGPISLDQISSSIGCCSHSTLANTPVGPMFADKENAYLIPESGEPIRVGDAIYPILNGTAFERTRRTEDFFTLRNVAVYHNGFYRLSFATEGITSETAFHNDNEWWFDLRGGEISDFGWYGEQTLKLSSYVKIGNTLYGGSSDSGKIFILNQLEFKDDGVNIEVELWSKYYALGSEYVPKIFKRAGFNLSADKEISVFVQYIIDQGKVWSDERTIVVPASIARWDEVTWDNARFYLGEAFWNLFRFFFSSSDRGNFIGLRLRQQSDSNFLIHNGVLSYARTGRIL